MVVLRCSEDYLGAHPKVALSDITKACYPNMPQNLSTIDLLMLGDPTCGGECGSKSGKSFNRSSGNAWK